MISIPLPRIGTVSAWRREARRLARAGVPSDAVVWARGGDATDLFSGGAVTEGDGVEIRLPRTAIGEIETALSHSDPERFARAYSIVLRLARGELRWGDRTDPALRRLLHQAKAVRRDIHKMHAFVRFRELPTEGPRRRFGAWFEPEHPSVEAGTPFFAKRFGDMDWVIATPDLTARFIDGALGWEETVEGAHPPEDATEDLWRAYYSSIFNPARLMVKAMQSEMPKKYWKNLPEAPLIHDLIRTAPARAREMREMHPTIPDPRKLEARRRMAEKKTEDADAGSLAELRRMAEGCRRCPLWKPATQVVFGEGPEDADLMIVGEQPGDQEDLAGRPFVGPAGRIFDRIAAEAGLDRQRVWVTNAVKHFKYKPRGKVRIHQRPDSPEIRACSDWLKRERELIRPKLILAMGATALEALTGDGKGILKRRGGVEADEAGRLVLVTVHPSYLLRLPDHAKSEAEDAFRRDLACAVEMVAEAA